MLNLRAAIAGLTCGFFIALTNGCQSPQPACGPDTCFGCCLASGVCASGTTPTSCGRAGATCVTCQAGMTCEPMSASCRATTSVHGSGGGGFDINAGGGGGAGGHGPTAPETVTSYRPAPVSGGSLTLMGDDLALVADADRERLWRVRLSTGDASWVQFPDGSRPRRVVVAAGMIHVLLRGAGTIAHINPSTFPERGVNNELWQVDEACPEPRDLAVDPGAGGLLTTCRDGTLVHHVAGARTESRSSADVRDIIVDSRGVSYSTFLRAGLVGPAAQTAPGVAGVRAEVAWRTIPTPSGVLMLHQLASTESIAVRSLMSGASSYGTSGGPFPTDGGVALPRCGQSVVSSALTLFSPVRPFTVQLSDVLAVDVAARQRDDGLTVAVAAAGGSGLSMYDLRGAGATTCHAPFFKAAGQFTGVAFTSDGRLVAHDRAGSSLLIVPLNALSSSQTVRYASDSVDSEGSRLFHVAPVFSQPNAAAVACASCHPEATEDGHTWRIDGQPRRTQNLLGGVSGRAPFHWVGDLPTLDLLMGDTFVRRMGGAQPLPRIVQNLAAWLDAQPALKAGERPEAQRTAGRAAFEKAGCNGCHAGSQLAGQQANVGTGGFFKTPTLIGVHARVPLMHSGCASSLRDRFENTACGGGPRHGNAAALSTVEFENLIGYLESI